MPKYNVVVDFAGYARGYEVYEVEAETEQDAMDNWHNGKEVEHEVIRDDCDREVESVEEIK